MPLASEINRSAERRLEGFERAEDAPGLSSGQDTGDKILRLEVGRRQLRPGEELKPPAFRLERILQFVQERVDVRFLNARKVRDGRQSTAGLKPLRRGSERE